MSHDLILKPECNICGTNSSNLYGSNCKHLTICFNCGKSMAEKKQICSLCGTLVTRLIREYNVRASSDKDKNYFIAKFANGLPDFNNEGNQWSLRKDSEMSKKNEPLILEDETGKIKYHGRREESSTLLSYYFLMWKNHEFVAVPADFWCNFRKVTWGNHQLTPEQADTKMKDLENSTDECGRWMMRTEKIQVVDDEVDPIEKGDDWEHEENFSDDDEEVCKAETPVTPETIQETNPFRKKKTKIFVSKSKRNMNVVIRETASSSASAVTEEEIRAALLEMGPVTSNELSNRFKSRLITKKDLRVFASNVKKIAKMQRNVGSSTL